MSQNSKPKPRQTGGRRRQGMLVWGISERLRTDFHASCLKKRPKTTIQKVISDFMIKFVAENP